MNLIIIITIIAIHWLADFVLQSDQVAKGKSSSFRVLLQHGAEYSAIWALSLATLAVFGGIMSLGLLVFIAKFALITFITHTAIDYYTSKVHTQLWNEKKSHEFFVSVGFDQLLHYIQLFLTFELLT